jgi:hypothetical protein
MKVCEAAMIGTQSVKDMFKRTVQLMSLEQCSTPTFQMVSREVLKGILRVYSIGLGTYCEDVGALALHYLNK